MSELRVIKGINGSKEVIVICPLCGRISQQLLLRVFNKNYNNELLTPHTCPVCGSIYHLCNSFGEYSYESEFSRYIQNPISYNTTAKNRYDDKRKTKELNRYLKNSLYTIQERHSGDKLQTVSLEKSDTNIELVTLEMKSNSSIATALVLCPNCTRISRQRLKQSFLSGGSLELYLPHTCPVCGRSYTKCAPSGNALWKKEIIQYKTNPASYNALIEKMYKLEKGSIKSTDFLKNFAAYMLEEKHGALHSKQPSENGVIEKVPELFSERFINALMKYPDMITSKRLFTNYMNDIFPNEKLKVYLLKTLFDYEIILLLQQEKRIDNSFVYRVAKLLEDNCGISKENAEWAVTTWSVCYGKGILGKTITIKRKNKY